jgi:hypothetical protein
MKVPLPIYRQCLGLPASYVSQRVGARETLAVTQLHRTHSSGNNSHSHPTHVCIAARYYTTRPPTSGEDSPTSAAELREAIATLTRKVEDARNDVRGSSARDAALTALMGLSMGAFFFLNCFPVDRIPAHRCLCLSRTAICHSGR